MPTMSAICRVFAPARNSRTQAVARTGALREPLARKQQETENEIGQALGWLCFGNMPPAEADELRKRWPNVDEAELAELRRKYG